MNRSLIGLIALLATACGGGDAAPAKPESSTSSKPAAASTTSTKTESAAPAKTATKASGGSQKWADSMGTATVSGKVNFKGDAPVMGALDTSSDAKCGVGAMDETLIVNGGGLGNVIISVSKGLDGYKFDDATGNVMVNQKGCQYIPHVIAMQAGQSIEIANSDDTVHNVHSYSKRNQSFNQAQPAGAAPIEKKMGRKDKMFPIKCDMHAWMNCHVAVFDHPFFTVSDANGAFTLPKLPAGTYTVTAQHETLGKQTAEVTVADNGAGTAAFTFSK